MKKNFLLFVFLMLSSAIVAEDGYRLWLRYDIIDNASLLQQYRNLVTSVQVNGSSQTIHIAKAELIRGIEGLLGKKITNIPSATRGIIAGTPATSSFVKSFFSASELVSIGNEGFIIRHKNNVFVIGANSDLGILYGVFHFLRLLQTHQKIQQLFVISYPKIRYRVLNHWDNLNRYVERGYAGVSIWNWHTLPAYTDPRYIDYARANASLGINGVSLTNVNANAIVLTKPWLEKVAALANIFRPYGIKVFLTARFSAPIELDKLKTADPLNDTVRQWWKNKVNEIYEFIPDFGGFLVKANSEGQPGPQNYQRTHADGANMLADVLAPHKGIVMWRAFVYGEKSEDRIKQAYDEFKPLDGKFRENVMVQVKNGPLDFQPREPFSPLFGAMDHTPLVMEFQLTQEYLGQGTHLVYEAPMFKEVLNSDTYAKGKGSFVSKIIDGSLYNYSLNGIAGVSNIGNERNWTGHLFGQANWYAFGRLAWNYDLNSEQIADEWIRQTFSSNPTVISTVKKIMLSSHEAMVNYMTPLGLHHIMGNGHHYGPAPWGNTLPRPDWNPVYFHRADSFGIGFDRTANGTNALAQYAPEVRKQFEELNSCDENYLLWFHHVSWKHKMRSGRTLWEELCYKYYKGVDDIRSFQLAWNQLEKLLDNERFSHVKILLAIQAEEAKWWRNSCLLYFQTFSGMAIPAGYEQPDKTLGYYKSLNFPYAPGN
jgi:alpha-glucuronidase